MDESLWNEMMRKPTHYRFCIGFDSEDGFSSLSTSGRKGFPVSKRTPDSRKTSSNLGKTIKKKEYEKKKGKKEEEVRKERKVKKEKVRKERKSKKRKKK